MKESQRTLLQIIVFALFFAYVILAIQFNSFKQPFLILLGVPFALIGVLAALLTNRFPAGGCNGTDRNRYHDRRYLRSGCHSYLFYQ
ncbi:MAG: efflux RND transporter permease subunit [Acidobacteriota bacterium]